MKVNIIVFFLLALLAGCEEKSEKEKLKDKAYVLYTAKDFKGAKEVLSSLLDKDPDSQFGHQMIAYCHRHLGNTGEAIRHARMALRDEPSDLPALLNLSTLYAQNDKMDSAYFYINTAVKYGKTSPAYWNDFSLVLYHDKNYDQALEAAREALSIDPDFAYAYNNIGLYQLKLDQPEKAVENIKKSINFDQDNAFAYRNLAYYQKATGKKEKVICETVKKAIESAYAPEINDELNEMKNSYCH